MEREELSLKNLYRIFTQRDYPVFSHGIIKERSLKGLTILKFYREIIEPSWISGRYGQLIFPTEGGRSRYSSELFNRRRQFPYYASFQKEILEILTPESCLRQMELFQKFLRKRQYDEDIFSLKLHFFIQTLEKQDSEITDEIIRYFKQYETKSIIPSLFKDSWILSILLLHGISGPAMNSASMQEFREDGQFFPESLFRMQKSLTKETPDTDEGPEKSELRQPELSKSSYKQQLITQNDLLQSVGQWGLYAFESLEGRISPAEMESILNAGKALSVSTESYKSILQLILPKLSEIDEYQPVVRELIDRELKEQPGEDLVLLRAYVDYSHALNEAYMEEMIHHLETMKALEQGIQKPWSRSLLQTAYINAVFLLFALKTKTETAEQLYQEYWKQAFSKGTPEQEILEMRMQAMREDFYGHSENAVTYTRQMLHLLSKTTGTNTRTYRISEYDLAMFLKKSGQIPEALETFHRLLAAGDDPKMNPDFYPLILLNTGVTYFQNGNLPKGKTLIREAYDLSLEKKEDFPWAESAYWLARVVREETTSETNDGKQALDAGTSTEAAYLQEALAYMQINYGTEHEKCRYIARRLQEIGQSASLQQ